MSSPAVARGFRLK